MSHFFLKDGKQDSLSAFFLTICVSINLFIFKHQVGRSFLPRVKIVCIRSRYNTFNLLPKLEMYLLFSLIFGGQCPVLDFWWRLLWVSKWEWVALFVLWWRCMWYTFPEIHLCCGQHNGRLLSPRACFSRGRLTQLRSTNCRRTNCYYRRSEAALVSSEAVHGERTGTQARGATSRNVWIQLPFASVQDLTHCFAPIKHQALKH